MSCQRWVHGRCIDISGRLRNNVDFNCRRCFEDGPDQAVLLREVEIEPDDKVECVSKF